MHQPRIALVHHWLVSSGGAERLLFELHRMYPEAPIYTAAYMPEKFPELAGADVRTTWLNRIPLAKTKHQLFPVLRGWSFKTLDLSSYDIVISSCAAEAKYVRTGSNTLHICYCHTPVRYYWSDYDWYLKHPPFGRLNWAAQAALPLMIGPLRRADFKASQLVDAYITNSKYVQDRITKYYNRDSMVIYPPIVTEPLLKLQRKAQDYYLIVGRQVAYKRLDLAVSAFNELGFQLKVVGTGEEVERQKSRSADNIEYLGWVSDDRRNELFAGAKGFIWPQIEDFGMTPVEAMAAACPVIAYAEGGALEYMVDGVTGVLFRDQTAEGLMAAVRRFEAMTFDDSLIRQKAKEFDVSIFIQRITAYVDDAWQKFDKKLPSGKR